ncbi:hypothetical protein GCM10022251_42610 [Phytohabitans flavus]|uniref:Uncharacterized protein n=1 Tax=Phytohabitans flavus TaxID=1076124 RepID=A0A6F8XZ72_9ACTN|nr:DUF6766 family protein [Phytohabitans flavus]BCB79031.1 hypothetical protein Pflav_054410 [Phytohabitans flavus]
MRRWLWFNALALVTFGAFLLFLVLQSVFGWQMRNEQLVQFGREPASYWVYLGSGHFIEAVFENWESEFLQMGSYVLLTGYLVQRGSPESKPLHQTDRPDDYPEAAGANSPAFAKKRGLAYVFYRNSLSIVLFAGFFLSFALHVLGGTADYNEVQKLEHGAPPVSPGKFVTTSDFWFQSMQNWQSEFLAVGALIVLSIVLRQHGSPQSKPVVSSDAHTGE